MGHGADWIKNREKLGGKGVSPLGEEVADLLGSMFAGIYHIETSLRNVKWNEKHVIVINLRGGLATYDFDELTKLVVLSHDRCLRVEMKPHTFNSINLIFTKRKRGDGNSGIFDTMPTMEVHLQKLRQKFTEIV